MTDDGPRLLSRHEAAAYCGCSPSTFSRWVTEGYLPRPLFGSKRWDKRAIDAAIDRASGIDTAKTEEVDPMEKWLKGIGVSR